jgi:hypothetical protein
MYKLVFVIFACSNKSSTLPVEGLFNYTTLDLSPNGCTLIAVNEGITSNIDN